MGETNIELIARVCHEANRAYALATGENPENIYPTWDDAPAEIQESARVGVRRALEGFTPEGLHRSWVETKVKDGWTYGPVRDNAQKIHPCMVPYRELPDVQKVKDSMFQAIVKALSE